MMRTLIVSALLVLCFAQLSYAGTECSMKMIDPFFADGQQSKAGDDCQAKNGDWYAQGCKVTYCETGEFWTGTYTCLEQDDNSASCKKYEIECCKITNNTKTAVEIVALTFACLALLGVIFLLIVVCMMDSKSPDDEVNVEAPFNPAAIPMQPVQSPQPANDLTSIDQQAKNSGHIKDVTNQPQPV